MKLTEFTFFKNTPLIDFQNTIHFSSNAERDDFFITRDTYDKVETTEGNFNFIRDRSTVDITVNYDDFRGVNYCSFLSEFEPNTRYYAYVIEYEYINDEVTRVYLLIDGIMTHTQGNVLTNMRNLTIQRQHLSKSEYSRLLWYLKNNSDVLQTTTKSYFNEQSLVFDEFYVLIHSGVDLLRDFGTVDKPLIDTSSGTVFDKITSPINLYVVEMNQFNTLMGILSKYPWIAQNLQKLILIPKDFLENNITKVNSEFTLSNFDGLYVISGTKANRNTLIQRLSEISYDMSELYNLFGLDSVQDRHLLRSEYGTLEVYDWNGSQLFVDLGQLNESAGLDFRVNVVIGYHNELAFFIGNYRNEQYRNDYTSGSYLNDSIIFKDFDDVPMLIDNYNLALAKNANRRELAESKLLTNRIGNILDPSAKLEDRFMNAASLISGFSLNSIFGKFTDEYEYYRNQKAEMADMALETPTITSQTYGNSFQIANDEFGLHLKMSKPSEYELEQIKKYYKLFGFEVNEENARLGNIDNMTICNFVQFSGSWSLPNVDVAIIEMMKAQFENGVRFWHNNGTPEPMNMLNVMSNEMR